MRFGSVCSGIEAASAAWHPFGWQTVFVSEIEKFPCAVLAHHYPNVPNYGDMTKYQEWPDANINVLVGGTPCQSFSVAGLRKGLDDPRGNLMLTYGAVAKRYRPDWLVWENVPGVLSSNGGRDFGTFLGMLEQLGYGFAYRVFDAQYIRVESHARAVPQRRRRVFVVGCLGDWRRAAAVLFERESLQGDSAPRREAGQRIAPTVASGPPFSRTGNSRVESEAMVTGSLDCRHAGGFQSTQSAGANHLVPTYWNGEQVTQTLDAVLAKGQMMPEKNRFPVVLEPITIAVNETVGSLCAEAGPNTHGSRGVSGTQTQLAGYIQPVAFTSKDHGADADIGVSPTLRAMPHDGSHANGGGQVAVAFDTQQITSKANRTRVGPDLPASTLAKQSRMHVASPMAVRRLTPRECERLQGFPDDYTLIPYRGKPAADGPRYKALGNSMAVNVMSWIGQRIDLMQRVDATQTGKQ